MCEKENTDDKILVCDTMDFIMSKGLLYYSIPEYVGVSVEIIDKFLNKKLSVRELNGKAIESFARFLEMSKEDLIGTYNLLLPMRDNKTFKQYEYLVAFKIINGNSNIIMKTNLHDFTGCTIKCIEAELSKKYGGLRVSIVSFQKLASVL